MIVTEHGLTFAREADAWRCVERPTLLMVRGERYRIEGSETEYPTLAAALAPAAKPTATRRPANGRKSKSWM